MAHITMQNERIRVSYREGNLDGERIFENHCHARYETIAVFEGRMSIVVDGERYTLGAGEIKICQRDGEVFNYQFTANNSYKAEMEYFFDIIENDKENTQNPPESSALTIKLIDTLVESADNDGKVIEYSI